MVDENDTGTKKPDEGDKDKGNEGMAVVTKAMEDMTKAVTGSLKSVTESQAALAEKLESIGKPPEGNGDDDDDDGDDDNSLEHLSNKELVQHIRKGLVKDLKKDIIDPLREEVKGTREATDKESAQRAVKEARAEHEDFDAWLPELQKMAQVSPELPIQDMYLLARAKDPEKAKKIDEELTKAKGGDKDKDKDKGKGAPFGGLTPTSGQTVENAKMSKKDASESAWNKTIGSTEAIGEGAE